MKIFFNFRFVILFLFTFTIIATPNSFQASHRQTSGDTEDGFRYLIENDAATILMYLGNEKVVIIPPKINGVPVTTIGGNAFIFKGVQQIVIPDGVTQIGYSAFSNCRELTTINLPESVISIGKGAFESCESLVSIKIPKSLKAIEEAMFWGCESLTMKIPNHITEIKRMGFYGCSSLVDVIIPDSITSIGDDAFSWCTRLNSLTIPNSVKHIGYFGNPQKVVIYGYQGSYIQKIALERGYDFLVLDNEVSCYSGDATNDGTVDIRDMLSIIDYIVLGKQCESMNNADATGDGKVDLRDLIWIVENEILEM